MDMSIRMRLKETKDLSKFDTLVVPLRRAIENGALMATWIQKPCIDDVLDWGVLTKGGGQGETGVYTWHEVPD